MMCTELGANLYRPGQVREGRVKVYGGRSKCRQFGTRVWRLGEVYGGRVKSMELGDGVWSLEAVFGAWGKCI